VFEQALQALGWTVGRDLRIDYRGSGNDPATIQKFAAEIAALAPDVILASGNIGIAPMLRAAPTTPIVFAQVIDPVRSGFVRSMARPGGNVTGFTQFEYSLAGKWLELLKEIAPGVTRVAVVRDPTRGPGIGQFAVIQAMAPTHAVELTPMRRAAEKANELTSPHIHAEQRNELAPFHSITSSARASSVGGISRPSALAVLRLITSSYLVGCWTGSSAGLAPLRTLPA
jgi:ABC-type uncharacterized transport system substrate-binding protein